VRERDAISLSEAIRKMTLLPAQRLESTVPEMSKKGRVQPGSDADLTIFDPELVIDRATYEEPDRYSEGIVHVLVAGTFVVVDGRLLEDVRPGQPLRGRRMTEGD
jgi:N-acyl-D-aspartate/D-glutamate deacylase